MVKRLLILLIALVFLQLSETYAQITIGTVDAGPYTPGSSIAATFSLGPDCIKPGNRFNLYLVSPGGTEELIGFYDSFYSTFVNGRIPSIASPGPGYVLRIKSTNPVHVSNDSNPFDIVAGAAVTASLSSSAINDANPETFGFCFNKETDNQLYISNESTASGTVTASITNELAGGTPIELTFGATPEIFTVGAAHYTMFAKVKMPDGRTATKAYFIINNKTNTAFSTSGAGVVCLPEGTLKYGVFTETDNGVQLNFPGNIYKIVWGDGSSDIYTLCDLKKGFVEHKYTTSSCGRNYNNGSNTFYNVFGINISAESPFCGLIGNPLSTYAKVIDVTENKFSGPLNGCANTPYTFYNESVAGQNPSATDPECEDKNVKYNWYINGVIFKANQPRSYNLQFPPSPSGVYEIKLVSVSSGICQDAPFIQTLCIQNLPEPAFDFNGVTTSHCAPFSATVNDKSVIDAHCNSNNSYLWSVTRNGIAANSSDVTFTNGITEPQFTFHKQGTYEVSLQINTATCGPVSTTSQTVVIIDSEPKTVLAPVAIYCGLGTFTYNDQPGLTNVQFSGTEVDATDTYTWGVTAEDDSVLPATDYSFKDGVNVTKYPTITFNQYRTYKVSVTHKNSCNEFTTYQLVTFKESPTPSIIADPICYNDQASIKGSISNSNYISYTWSTPPGGGTFLNGNTLEPTYTPSGADRTAGKAIVTLTVNTGLTDECEFVSTTKEIIIYPNNTAQNTTQTICTGTSASRILSSDVVGSTFTWTATNADGNATGFSPMGSGDINETITNNNTTQNAVIVYTIIPKANGCPGVPFTFTVTVTPKPIINTLELNKTICEEQPVAIKVTSNIPARFIWTSVPSAGVSGNTNPTTKTTALNEFTIPDVLTNDTFLPGTVTYTIKSYSDSDTECPGNEIIVVVTVDPKVTQAIAGPDDSICATNPSNTYTLKGNKPDVGTGLWTLVSTHTNPPTIADPGNFETTVSGLVAGDPYLFEWAISGNGKCSGTKDQVQITVTPIPVLSAPVTDKTICHNNSVAITINSDIPAQFSWTSTASPGVTGNTGDPNPTTLSALSSNITINDVLSNNTFSQGTVTYTITPHSESGCPGTSIVVVVKVDPAVSTANAGQDAIICNTDSYDLKGNKPDVGSGQWELVSASRGTPVIATPTDFETTVSGLEPGGVYTFKWTITGAGVCAKSEAFVTITVNMPTIPGITNGGQTVCQNNNSGIVTLSGNTGDVLGWQALPDGETIWASIPGVNTNPTYTFSNLTVTTQFRAVVQNAGCTIEYSTPTTITVAPATTIATVGTDQTLCNLTFTTLTGNTPASGETGTWTKLSGPVNVQIRDPSSSTTTVTNLDPGVTYIFRWTITGNSPCGPTFADQTVRNNAPINQNISNSTLIVCNGAVVTIDGSLPTGGDQNGVYSYTWETSINGGPWTLISAESAEDLTRTLTTPGQIGFRRIVTSGGCTLTSNELIFTVQPPISGNTIVADQTICSGTAPTIMTGDGTLTGGDGSFLYQWQSSPDGTNWTNIIGAQNPDYQPLIITSTTFYRRLVSTAACTNALQSVSNTIKKMVNPNAKAEYTWTNDINCAPFALQINAVTYPDRNGTYTWRANGTVIGTGSAFPGYTLQNSNDRVTISLTVTSSLGCSSDLFEHDFTTNQAVPAMFTPIATTDCGPLTVNFVNTSIQTAGATFRWNFGNGRTSNDTNPQPVTFQPDPSGKDTTYVVTLYSITSCGIDSAKGSVLVKSLPKPIFSPSTTNGCSPLSVNFTNNSPLQTGITYTFNFGDGTPPKVTSDRSTVNHVYNTTTNTQTFNATMSATSECGTVTTTPYQIVVRPNTVVAELVVNGTQLRGCAPFTVTFDNNSTGATDFIVDFKDGTQPRQSIISPERFTHTFTAPGTYDVTLTATNGCSTGTTTETIIVLPQPLTDFEADNTLGCPGLVVRFKNKTQNGVSYIWDFGDGSPISNEFEPTHTYTGNQEYYTVTLTATNNLGCTMAVTKNQYIHIVQPPVAAFHVNPSTLINIPDYTFRFEDESTNTPTIWEWDFGDGTGSALKNPSHTYLDTGTYRVTLKTINQQGCFTSTFKNVTIKGVPGYLFVPNSFVPGDTQPELREFRAKGSGMATWRFSIFNKWGQLLWETTKLEEGRPVEGWDGTFKGQQLPQGVYYWKIDVQMVNGSEWKGMTYDSSAPRRTGAIHLIR